MSMAFRVCLVLLGVVVVAACSGGPEARKARRYAEDQLCPQQRPEVCTMDYTPVCALLENGRRKEYSNACSACSDPVVVSYQPDACP